MNASSAWDSKTLTAVVIVLAVCAAIAIIARRLMR